MEPLLEDNSEVVVELLKDSIFNDIDSLVRHYYIIIMIRTLYFHFQDFKWNCFLFLEFNLF